MLQMIELCITDKLDYKNKTFPAQIKVLITDMTILQQNFRIGEYKIFEEEYQMV